MSSGEQITKMIFIHLQLESGGEQDLDALDQTQSDYLSAASDLEDTDGEVFTDGEAYTDNEDLDEAYPGQNAANPSRIAGAALARSSEPAFTRRSPSDDSYSHREVPPLMHVPEPRAIRRESYSPPHSAPEEEGEEEPSQRSFTDSDFSALDADAPNTPSDGPPDFVAPNPPTRHYVSEPTYADAQPESPQHASLSTIEEKLQQVKKIYILFIFKGPMSDVFKGTGYKNHNVEYEYSTIFCSPKFTPTAGAALTLTASITKF